MVAPPDVEIRERLEEVNPEALLLDGCDAALVGIACRCGQPSLAVYCYDRRVVCFINQGMTAAEAREWIAYNVASAWLGEHTPIILHR